MHTSFHIEAAHAVKSTELLYSEPRQTMNEISPVTGLYNLLLQSLQVM